MNDPSFGFVVAFCHTSSSFNCQNKTPEHSSQQVRLGKYHPFDNKMALGYSATVVVIIFGAIGCVVLAFAVWRLLFYNPGEESGLEGEIPVEQKEYMRDLRERHRNGLFAEARMRG